MATIPGYNQRIIRPRQVANIYNPQAIQNAGSFARGTADVAQTGMEVALKIQQANDVTAVNEAIIQKQRSDLDYLDQTRQDRNGNPFGFAKEMEPEIVKRDDEIMNNLPSSAAKKAFKETATRLNLQSYESNLNWENTRSTQIFAERIESSIDQNNLLMLRAGQEGAPIDDYLKNVDASTIAAGGVFAPEKLADINRTGRSEGLSYYIQGMAERDPYEAKKLLDSKKYDEDLGADRLSALYTVTDREIERSQAKVKMEVKEDAAAIEKAAGLGLKTPDDVITSLADRADALEIEGLGDSLRSFGAVQDTASEFAVKSVADQRVQLEDVGKSVESGDLSRVDEYAALQNVLNTKTEMINGGQGWEYYSSHDIVASPEPFDMSDPVATAQAIQARRTDVERVLELEGFAMPILTKQEVDTLKQTYNEGGTSGVAEMLTNIGDNMNFNEKRSLANMMSKTDASMLAAALNQPTDIAEGILRGSRSKGEVTTDKVRQKSNELLGGYIFDPDASESVHSAVYAYYKDLSLKAGDASKEVDTKRLQKAVDDVIGKPAEISVGGKGSKVFLYRNEDGNFEKASSVEQTLKSMDLQVLRAASNGAVPMTSDGTVLDNKDIVGKAQFITYGDGQLIAEYPGLGVIVSDKGGPFIFDLRKMKQAYATLGKKRDTTADYNDLVSQGYVK